MLRAVLWLALAVPMAATAQFDEFVAKAKTAVAHDLKDPGSAQFRGTYISEERATRFLCGEINAKNSYGAYVGFRKFVATDETGYGLNMIRPERGEARQNMFDRVWIDNCTNKIADVQ